MSRWAWIRCVLWWWCLGLDLCLRLRLEWNVFSSGSPAFCAWTKAHRLKKIGSRHRHIYRSISLCSRGSWPRFFVSGLRSRRAMLPGRKTFACCVACDMHPTTQHQRHDARNLFVLSARSKEACLVSSCVCICSACFCLLAFIWLARQRQTLQQATHKHHPCLTLPPSPPSLPPSHLPHINHRQDRKNCTSISHAGRGGRQGGRRWGEGLPSCYPQAVCTEAEEGGEGGREGRREATKPHSARGRT